MLSLNWPHCALQMQAGASSTALASATWAAPTRQEEVEQGMESEEEGEAARRQAYARRAVQVRFCLACHDWQGVNFGR